MSRKITAERIRQDAETFEIDSKMSAQLSNMSSGARIEFGVMPGLVDMYIIVAKPNGDRVVETIHLPHFASEWASLIEKGLKA